MTTSWRARPRRGVRATDSSDAVSEHRAIMRAISGLLLSTLLATLSTNILATALPRVLVDLHVGIGEYTWVVTAYILVLTVSVPIWGKLSDVWQKKRLLQAVLAIYLLGSIVAGGATNGTLLVVGRAIQGLGTGGLAAVGQTVLAALISPRQRGRYSGYSGVMFAIGTVSGPLVGGALVNTPLLGWRACFFAPIPLGLLSSWLIQRNLHVPSLRRPVGIDYLGAALVTCATALLIGWVSLAGTFYHWWSGTTAAMLGAAAVVSVVAVIVESRTNEPMFNVDLLRMRSVGLASFASFFAGVLAFAVPVFLSQYFQLSHELTPIESGLATIPVIAGIFLASWTVGRLITHTGRMRRFLVLGAVSQVTGCVLVTLPAVRAHAALLGVAMLLLGVGIGVLQQNLVLYAQNTLPVSRLGSGSATIQFCRFLGGALGVSVLGALSAGRVSHAVVEGVRHIGRTITSAQAAKVPDYTKLSDSLTHIYTQSYSDGLVEVFLIMTPLTLLSLAAICVLREQHLAEHVRVAPSRAGGTVAVEDGSGAAGE